MERKRVCLIVLGDFGRSPRMMNHSLSLLKHGFIVDIIAHSESRPGQLLNNPNICFHCVKDYVYLNQNSKIVFLIFKTIFQSFLLLYTLFNLIKPNYILIQNPPSIPTLLVTWLFSWFSSAKIIIDWHNYGHTILALSLGSNHLFVKMYSWCEGYFGSKSYYNFCVSQAMKKDLREKWGIDATVLYDNPSDAFHSIDIYEKHKLFTKLGLNYPQFKNCEPDCTKFTKIAKNGNAIEKKNRPVLIMTSTSWTQDEDFDILLQALEKYDDLKKDVSKKLPFLVCLITGQGLRRDYYHNLILSKTWNKIEFVLAWLENEDYSKVLASSDIGISLHKSSSNLDLPMKIVDMFGSCLPVIAYNYNCLHELVKHKQNGVIFETSDELYQYLLELLQDFPKGTFLNQMKQNLIKNRSNLSWDKTWNKIALPVFES